MVLPHFFFFLSQLPPSTPSLSLLSLSKLKKYQFQLPLAAVLHLLQDESAKYKSLKTTNQIGEN